MVKRVSVYIDGANFVYGLKTLNPKYSDYHFDFENFIKMIVGKNDLIDIFYYNASLKQAINPRRFREQQKLLARLRKITKCKVILCKRQKRFGKYDEEYYTIKGDDINLALDMLNDAWENKYDETILISGDGDFVPLLKYVKNKNKKVQVISFEKIASMNLINEADRFIFINKKTANKFFWRGEKKEKVEKKIEKKEAEEREVEKERIKEGVKKEVEKKIEEVKELKAVESEKKVEKVDKSPEKKMK